MISRRVIVANLKTTMRRIFTVLLLFVAHSASDALMAQESNGLLTDAFDSEAPSPGAMEAIVPPLSSSWAMNPLSSPPRLPASNVNHWYLVHSTHKWIRLRGRIDFDILGTVQNAASVATFGDLGDEAGLRRARIGAEGNPTDYLRYVSEIDLSTGNVILRDNYFALGKLTETGEYKFGHMREPFSLEGGTSANVFGFMERSQINSLDPARSWGVGYSACGQQEDWTFSGGIFQAGIDASDLIFGQGSTTALTTRWTRLAWYEDDGRSLMHFGLSLSERLPDNSVIVINQKPASTLISFDDSTGSPFVPKIKIAANYQELVNLQWAYVDQSFWAQAEFYSTYINQLNGGPVFYHGGYLDLGYFLTGEHRQYLRQTGVFGPVSVKRPFVDCFSSKAHEDSLGYGAWEATARLGYADYISGNAPLMSSGLPTGVWLPQLTVGMNWYLADRMRLMFNYSYVLPDQASTGTSAASVLGMRLAVYW